jgi:hypothetical protein
MVREGNDARADSQDHARMDLTVSPNVCGRVHRCLHTLVQITAFVRAELITSLKLPGYIQVFGSHHNHDSLLFLGIHVFNDTRVNQALETEISGIGLLLSVHICRHCLVLLQPTDVIFVQNQVSLVGAIEIVVNYKQGSAHSARICENLELSVADISNQGYFVRNEMRPTQVLHSPDKVSGVSMYTHPHAVDEDLCSVWRT